VPELECAPAQGVGGWPALDGQVVEVGQRVLGPGWRQVAAENKAPQGGYDLEVEQRRSVQVVRLFLPTLPRAWLRSVFRSGPERVESNLHRPLTVSCDRIYLISDRISGARPDMDVLGSACAAVAAAIADRREP
jgi:hypothetical protein